ncbi:MAG: alpha/beta hydrolase [Thermocrispum sp.]
MNKILAALAAAGVAVGATLLAPSAGAAPEAAPADDPPAIEWGDCEDPDLVDAGAKCGKLTVPLDYSRPDGDKIKLAVSRVKHKSSEEDYQGPMLVNPGGPGGSGLSLSVLGQFVPENAGDTFDWIGFDPRGVGASEPALTCDPDYFRYNRPDYVPTTLKLEKTWLKRSKGYAQACGKAKANALLPHLKTRDVVKDMDSLRRALGAKKINYYGFSYGTYLGQVYATEYPSKLNRVVFDGVVNPKDVWYQANLNQDLQFDRVIKIYFEWISRYDDLYHLGDDPIEVEQEFYKQKKILDSRPAGGKIGSDEWTDLFLPAGYGQYRWDAIAKAFSGWVHEKEWRPLKTLYDSASGIGDDNGFAVYLGVQCTDVQWPVDWEQWRADNWRIHKRAPFETWANAWYNAPCRYWPAEAGTVGKVDGSKAPPVLLISEEEDAATPFAGALEVRKRFPKSSLISLPGGTTHSGSLGGNACVDDQIADYLATGKLPERKNGNDSDAQCTPLPKPVPEGAKQRQVRSADQPDVLDRALETTAR